MIFQRDVLEELEVPLEITYSIASCFIISRRLMRRKFCHSFFWTTSQNIWRYSL